MTKGEASAARKRIFKGRNYELDHPPFRVGALQFHRSAMRYPGPDAAGESRRCEQAMLTTDLPPEADGRTAPDVPNRREMFFFGTLTAMSRLSGEP